MVAAAKLGARVGFVGTAGTDQAAELKLRSLRESGVDLSRLVRRSGPDDQVVAVFVNAESGERVFASMSHLREHPLEVGELDRAYLTSASYLHLDGFHAEAARQAARWGQEADQTVVLDGGLANGPIRPSLRRLLPDVDVLIAGQGFARHLTGLTGIWAAGEAVLTHGPQVYVETVGEAGCYTITGDAHFHTPAFAVEVVDTTGAGDVFHGAYIVGLLRGWPLKRVAQFASAVAAIKCRELGGRAGVPGMVEAVAFLRERGVTWNGFNEEGGTDEVGR
jgi:sugar/nucleoside kinase (ribokinase family)